MSKIDILIAYGNNYEWRCHTVQIEGIEFTYWCRHIRSLMGGLTVGKINEKIILISVSFASLLFSYSTEDQDKSTEHENGTVLSVWLFVWLVWRFVLSDDLSVYLTYLMYLQVWKFAGLTTYLASLTCIHTHTCNLARLLCLFVSLVNPRLPLPRHHRWAPFSNIPHKPPDNENLPQPHFKISTTCLP